MSATQGPAGAAWLFRPRPVARPGLRLFFFPYAGATAQVYRGLCMGLPEGVEGCAVQLPGRSTRYAEAPITRMAPLVEALAGALPLDAPFAFFGHSLGSIISFELARALRRRGGPEPRKLFLSGRRGPQLPPAPPIHALPEREFIDELVRRYNGIPAELLREPELLAMFLPPVRADFELYETWSYSPEAPLDAPFAVFGGLSDPQASRAQLEAWREHTRGGFSLLQLPGDHFYLQPAQAELLGALRRELSGL
jgi:medium-chain acyl-[acyl-carrier-protein] hydrolase